MKKIVVENQRNYNNFIHNALWEDRVTSKIALGTYFYLVYG